MKVKDVIRAIKKSGAKVYGSVAWTDNDVCHFEIVKADAIWKLENGYGKNSDEEIHAHIRENGDVYIN